MAIQTRSQTRQIRASSCRVMKKEAPGSETSSTAEPQSQCKSGLKLYVYKDRVSNTPMTENPIRANVNNGCSPVAPAIKEKEKEEKKSRLKLYLYKDHVSTSPMIENPVPASKAQCSAIKQEEAEPQPKFGLKLYIYKNRVSASLMTSAPKPSGFRISTTPYCPKEVEKQSGSATESQSKSGLKLYIHKGRISTSPMTDNPIFASKAQCEGEKKVDGKCRVVKKKRMVVKKEVITTTMWEVGYEGDISE